MHDHQTAAKKCMIAGQVHRAVSLLGPVRAIQAQLTAEADTNHRARIEAFRDHFSYLAESFPSDGVNAEWHHDVILGLLIARRELRMIDLDARLVQLEHFRGLIDGLTVANRLDAIEAAVVAPDHEQGREAFHDMRRLAEIPADDECSTPARSRECMTPVEDRRAADRRTASTGAE